MANSDYIVRPTVSGFCPSADLQSAITPLTSSVTIVGYTSPIPNGVRIGMAAMIDNEIVKVNNLVGNALTLGRGCCDTVPAAHSAGATIWFFDDSFGNDGIEYGATETISVKLLPRTFSGGSVPIENSPPNGITFNWRFYRPYPPGLLRVNGDPWFDSKVLTQDGVNNLTLTWVHRDRVSQQDQLVDHLEASIGPEVGTTYRVEVRKADNTLLNSTPGITGTSWSRSRATLISDFAVTGGLHAGYITVVSVRDGYDSYQAYRIDFILNASNPVSADQAMSYAVNNAPALNYLFKFNFNGTDGQSAITNTGSYGGSYTAPTTTNGSSFSPYVQLETTGPKFGSACAAVFYRNETTMLVNVTQASFHINSTDSLVVGGWMKRSANLTGGSFLGIEYLSSNLNVFFGFGAGNKLSLGVNGSGLTQIDYLGATDSAVLNQWYYFEINVSSTNVYLFVDGTLVASGSFAKNSSGTTANVRLLNMGSGFNNFSYADDLFVAIGTGSVLHTASFTPPGELT